MRAFLILNCLRGLDGAGVGERATAFIRDNRDGFDDTVAKTAKIDIRTKSFETDHSIMVYREKIMSEG